MPNDISRIRHSLSRRFGETLTVDEVCPASTSSPASPAAACTGAIPSARSIADLLRLFCACALSAPSKSDLQQADIVIASKADQA